MRLLRFVHIYNGSRAEFVRLDACIEFLQELMPALTFDVRNEKDILGDVSSTAKDFAFLRVRDISNDQAFEAPQKAEVDYEMRRITDPQNTTSGILYDGFRISEILLRHIPAHERNLSHLHVYITNQIMASYDPEDRRYHARYGIFSYPCIISTTGIVVAPARPREYYIAKHRLKSLAGDEIFDTMIKEQMKGRFIDYEDERMNDCLKGILLQSIFFQESGYPFCNRRDCRLFNAHWQEDLIRSQVGVGIGLCKEHLDFVMGHFS